MEHLIYQNIAGYSTNSSANLLKEAPVFQLVLDKSKIASQASLFRFWDRISEENIHQMQQLNQAMIDNVQLARNTTELIFDLDSTHSDTYGDKEKTDYNVHYQNQWLPSISYFRWGDQRFFEGITSFWL